MKHKLPLFGLVTFCLIFVGYFSIGYFNFSNSNNGTNTNSIKNSSTSQTISEQKICSAAVKPPDKKKPIMNSATEFKDIGVATNNTTDDMDELISVNIQEIQKRMDEELTLLKHLPKKDLHAYNELLRKVNLTNDPYDIVHIVDLVTCIPGRYIPIPENKDKLKRDYYLIDKTLRAIKNSQLYISDNKRIRLEEMRLLILKRRIENYCLIGIQRDKESAKLEYVRLQQIEPETDLEKYLKMALLYDAQSPLLSAWTTTTGLDYLISRPPEVKDVQEKITVTRLRTWAFLDKANRGNKSTHQLLTFWGQLYQYVIDSYETIDSEMFSGMSDYDKEFFEGLVKQAVTSISELRSQCDSLGIDLERALQHKQSVEDFGRE